MSLNGASLPFDPKGEMMLFPFIFKTNIKTTMTNIYLMQDEGESTEEKTTEGTEAETPETGTEETKTEGTEEGGTEGGAE